MAICSTSDEIQVGRLIRPGVIRLSELIGALSVALDLTEGQPAGHAAKSCLIGMRLARIIGIAEKESRPLYYALLLKDLGCSSNAAKMCWLFGADDRIVKSDVKLIDWTKATQRIRLALSRVAPGASTIQKILSLAAMAKEGESGARQLIRTRCERGAEIARMLNFPEETATAITHLDEHWNGKGHPFGLCGEDIPLASRVMGLAQTMEVFHASQGLQKAVEVARYRRGKWFDPQLVDAMLELSRDYEFWKNLNGQYAQQLGAAEPGDQLQYADENDLDRVSLAFASVVDAKSPWTFQHSEGVARIAVGIAESMGFTVDQTRDLRRAGLLHDIGKLGVSNMILDKPGRPTNEEYAKIRLHPDYSKQILDGVELFSDLSDVAAAHHERLDGNGYHRQIPGQRLRLESRILAVADVCEALSAKRPYRDALPQEKVRENMAKDLGTGLCPDCFSGLESWWDRTSFTPRVEAQLAAIEQLHQELA